MLSQGRRTEISFTYVTRLFHTCDDFIHVTLLIHTYAEGRLFLKDTGPGDLIETTQAAKTGQESLQDSISVYLKHLQDFRGQADPMSHRQVKHLKSQLCNQLV